MMTCVTCGDELHPERAKRYDYCTRPGCQERNARGLDIVAVGVNKAADQYVVLTDRTRREMEGGRYRKEPRVPGSLRTPSGPARSRPNRSIPRQAAHAATGSSSASRRPRRWSTAQENLAITYHSMGMKPDQIAEKLGISPSLATQILLTATRLGRR